MQRPRRRTFAWFWAQFSECLAQLREDANERDLKEAMLKETKPPKEKTVVVGLVESPWLL